MPKPIIVTGAAGFIGRNVVDQLNRQGHTALILVDTLGITVPGEPEKWRNLLGLRFDDLLSPDQFLQALEDGRFTDAASVIHLGACSATTEHDADFLLQNNYRYSRTLCEWCLRQNVRFVYASSAATYGDGRQGYSDDDAVTPSLRPLNMYGYSKQIFDLWALQHNLFKKIVGLKYFNVFGPYEDHKGDMRSVVAKSYEQIKATGKVQLFKSYRPDYADGEQKRDFLYVQDAAAMTLHFTQPGTPGGLYNCGTGLARTWLDLAHAVFAALGVPPQIEFIPMPPQLQGKYQYFTQADMKKLRAAGYTAPFTTLEAAVADYIASYYKPRFT